VIGHDDLEEDDEKRPYSASHEFGWDCENPKRILQVDAFKIDALPITNGDYLDWLNSPSFDEEERAKLVPASWTTGKQGEEAVKTLWGEVEMQYAKGWPVAASADQLEQFAKVSLPSRVFRLSFSVKQELTTRIQTLEQAKGGRLPSQAELSLYLTENPSDHPLSNVGLSNLHATLPTLSTPARKLKTPASNGGLWEWTSTTLAAWDGFVGSQLYPGYSSDFHDERHRVVLGGSWASPRRIARQSFVNFYQSAYPYALIGARVAYNV
jgi:formylglycine-generating enzyme required for sulfatase activity